MSQKTDLLAIRKGVKVANLPTEVRTTALFHLDKLPDLYEKLEKTCESRFLDDILRHVVGMLKTIDIPSSIEAVTKNFQAMHERHGIPTLGLTLKASLLKRPKNCK
jgi:hypothetical protein